MNAQYDVVIVGAGLVGLSLAPALARTGLSVALVDRGLISDADVDAEGFDARVYAISPGSAAFLRAIGVWQALRCERVAPIESMHVEGDAGGSIEFSAYDLGERALAWVLEERELRAALLRTVRRATVELIGNATLDAIAWSASAATLKLADGNRFDARLVIGADGARSWVRQAAGIIAEPKSYGQTAVVANFACERAHHGRAYQWFRDDGGVLAWLPLPARRISMVWSAPDALAQSLLDEKSETLSARVAAAGRHALGALEYIATPAGFPLRFLRLPTSVALRLALVGDAAHGVHPLAGQGVNLGFGDAHTLAAVLAERGPVSDAGAPVLLERYARRRAEPVLAMQAVTDGLARLFGPPTPWLKSLRNAGISAVDRLPLLKRALAQPALR
ncbi:MAG TPA: UbiH/UbiF family hydroxylase [Casimicrobiaceae bacterium]